MSEHAMRSGQVSGCWRNAVSACLSFGLFMLVSLVVVCPRALGGPVHPALPGRDIAGFDRACGIAVESHGDVYVSSAGESKIRVYDPEHKVLAAILDGKEPCGLAVDSTGVVYVSDQKTGNVVKYAPNAYPFVGAPTYGMPATVVSSGKAKGISIDPFDGRLYVAESNRVGTYNPDGSLGVDEQQRVLVFEATGGTFTLSFDGKETKPINWNADQMGVKEALEEILGAGNVSVTQGLNKTEMDHLVTFRGAFGHADVGMLTADTSGLSGGTNKLLISEEVKGFSGHIGEGVLSEATGVAAYTYKVTSEKSDRYMYVTDAAGGLSDRVYVFAGTEVRTLKVRSTLDGSETPDGSFGFGPSGAYPTVDQGNGDPVSQECVSVTEQACTAGNFYVYDDAHRVVDEFDGRGRYFTQIALTEADPGFTDAMPTAIAVDRSGGAGEGMVYVTTGAGLGAQLLAYGPLPAPSRPLLATHSHILKNASAVTVDQAGYVYVASDTRIHIYDPGGKEVTSVEDSNFPFGAAIDGAGNVYVLDKGPVGSFEKEAVRYYAPDSYPPGPGTHYTLPVTVAKRSDAPHGGELRYLAVNTANGHVFVKEQNGTIELDSAENGSTILNHDFETGVGLSGSDALAVDSINGDVYLSTEAGIIVVNQAGDEILARITGRGSPQGLFSSGLKPAIAVDQSNGHVVVFGNGRGVVEEYDSGGGFVAEFGKFTKEIARPYGAAIDNSSGPNGENVYVAFDDTAPESFDVTTFDRLAYGESPKVVTGVAGGLGGGEVTLRGTVDPRGFDLTDCRFEYISESLYVSGGHSFANATSVDCAEGLETIGKGTGPVPVDVRVALAEPQERYRYRLLATNKYGTSQGTDGLFGVPVLEEHAPYPILYGEATVRGTVDPSGLSTKYRVEYGTGEAYGQSTSAFELTGGDGPVPVQVTVSGLAEGTAYHYRLVGENEDGRKDGSDQTMTTLERRAQEACPNVQFRTGFSAGLPDCRAYELVTPADTHGNLPYATQPSFPGAGFNNWLVQPRGKAAGESLAYFIDGTLPGFAGNGFRDAYHATRGTGEHPLDGWTNRLSSPTYTQTGSDLPGQHGMAADQQFSFWELTPLEGFNDVLPAGVYLRTPEGFELLGRGDLTNDAKAQSRYVSAGGTHAIFDSKQRLESQAPAGGTEAVYDRVAGSSSAQVISIKQDGSSFGEGQDASYVGATEDGSAVVFQVGGVLYLHRAGVTVEVASAPNTFAGISEDGMRVFYTASSSGRKPAGLFVCDTQTGSCAGGEAHAAVEIAPDSVFVNVSAGGSHAFFTSETVLDEAKEGTPGAHNLYAWDGTIIRFFAKLDPQDFIGFNGEPLVEIDSWTDAISAGPTDGRAHSPTRSTPDGSVFVFQSHSRLSLYDNEGFGEIYLYDPAVPSTERIVCLSCNPSGLSPTGDAMLQIGSNAPTRSETLISNVTDDGRSVVFQSSDPLVPQDANSAQDVYEWVVNGAGGCRREGGCLALISTGQGEQSDYLYGMNADGHDVFFTTLDKLVGSDVTGSPSIYDARVDGGIPEAPEAVACQGDACQGQPTSSPALSSPASVVAGEGNLASGGSGKQSSGTPRSLTRVQKLARALRACKRMPKRQRHRCEAQARRRYVVKKAAIRGRAGK